MNVCGGENRSFWMAHFEAQVLPNVLSPKPENLKLSMCRVVALGIWCFKYKNDRPSALSSGALSLEGLLKIEEPATFSHP
jgi:hypothetical protein